MNTLDVAKLINNDDHELVLEYFEWADSYRDSLGPEVQSHLENSGLALTRREHVNPLFFMKWLVEVKGFSMTPPNKDN